VFSSTGGLIFSSSRRLLFSSSRRLLFSSSRRLFSCPQKSGTGGLGAFVRISPLSNLFKVISRSLISFEGVALDKASISLMIEASSSSSLSISEPEPESSKSSSIAFPLPLSRGLSKESSIAFHLPLSRGLFTSLSSLDGAPVPAPVIKTNPRLKLKNSFT